MAGVLAATSVLILVNLATAADYGPNHGEEQKDLIKSALDQTRITLSKAITVAEKEGSKGRVIESGLHYEQGKPVFRVVISSDNNVREHYIDATNGEYMRFATQSDQPNPSYSGVKATAGQALDAAMKAVANARAFGADLEMRDGKAVYLIYLMADNSLKRVIVDCANGQVSKVEDGGYAKDKWERREANFEQRATTEPTAPQK